MDRFARTVLGYHGCTPEFAAALIGGTRALRDWNPSRNAYDWLGHGIYFWEYAPERARAWGRQGGVVGAIIQLGRCLDLGDTENTAEIRQAYHTLSRLYRNKGLVLPVNRGKRRDLDCLVLNTMIQFSTQKGTVFQTVRAPFLEGRPLFPGSAILDQSHVQIAVRDKSCILGLFRPTQQRGTIDE